MTENREKRNEEEKKNRHAHTGMETIIVISLAAVNHGWTLLRID